MRWNLKDTGAVAFLLVVAATVVIVFWKFSLHSAPPPKDTHLAPKTEWTQAPSFTGSDFVLGPGAIKVGWKNVPKPVIFHVVANIEGQMPVSVGFVPFEMAGDVQAHPQLLDDPVIQRISPTRCLAKHTKKTMVNCSLDIRNESYVMFVRDDRPPVHTQNHVMLQEPGAAPAPNKIHVSYQYKESPL